VSDWQGRREELRGAIAQLRAAALIDRDTSRRSVAWHLARGLDSVTTPQELREFARNSLGYYRGGMGSFQDFGTPEMAEAGERLRRALYRAKRRWW